MQRKPHLLQFINNTTNAKKVFSNEPPFIFLGSFDTAKRTRYRGNVSLRNSDIFNRNTKITRK